ncbi:MAG: 30S ribosomal protein S2 [Rhodobacterales bacterium]|nr:MAG: 30S ribosomal protein S2 [Rhodobacterales bacterium]
MALPQYTLKDLLESGVHFGHQTHRWNPLMQQYIYGVRNGIHIIDLTQTFQLLDVALNYVQDTVSKGGSILFVGTKRQAQKPISESAERSAQYYMNHRWLGGTLTNWKTVSNSISRLKKLDEQLSDGATGLTKKERLNLEREQIKLNASLGGIREMGGTPDLLFVIDTNKEALAIQEAKKLGIPVIAVIDTNSDPSSIDFPIPGNDDAARSISLYCDLIAKAALEGMTNQLATAGVDIGESIEPPKEELSTNFNAKNSHSEDKNIEKNDTDGSTLSEVNHKEDITDILQNDVKNLSANNENDEKEEKVSNLENDKLTQGNSSVDSKEKVSKTKNKEKTLKPSKVLKSANVKSKDVFEEKETAKDKKNSKESTE